MSSNEETVPHNIPSSPENLDPSWRYLALSPDRVPLKGMTATAAPGYWEGLDADWPSISAWVAEGNAVGVMPERSGLVILDCDTAKEWQATGNSARMVRQHGINDLTRVASEICQELSPTFTVQTKSGGYHLYYLQNPLCPVFSRGHREGWRIDVKASKNTFAVAPPTPGYSVVRDLPVAELPLWLAQWIQGLYKALQPLGGDGQRRRMGVALAMKAQLVMGGNDQETNLFHQWCQAMLSVVSASNQYGGWNNAIYLTAHEFFDVGLGVDDVLPMILEAASPYDKSQERAVVTTVESAWRKHADGDVYGYTHEVQ